MSNWHAIIKLIKHSRLHVFYSIKDEWANVTEPNGTVHKITGKHSIEYVQMLLTSIILKKVA